MSLFLKTKKQPRKSRLPHSPKLHTKLSLGLGTLTSEESFKELLNLLVLTKKE